MPWVRFSRKHTSTLTPRLMRCFEAGAVCLVHQKTAKAAIEAGNAIETDRHGAPITDPRQSRIREDARGG
jgi:hypothetical protein